MSPVRPLSDAYGVMQPLTRPMCSDDINDNATSAPALISGRNGAPAPARPPSGQLLYSSHRANQAGYAHHLVTGDHRMLLAGLGPDHVWPAEVESGDLGKKRG